MQRILITRPVFSEVIDRLAPVFEIESHDADAVLTPLALALRLADKDGVLTDGGDRIDAEVLVSARSLRAVANIAVGYNNLDLAALTAAGVMATNTPDVLTETTADFGWALLLATARRVTESEHFLRSGQWRRWSLTEGFFGAEVYGSTLGIIGMGRIGQAVARRAQGFGMRVLYHNRHRLDATTERRCNATWVTKADLLREVDHVMLVLPYTPENRHIIGAPELAQMKPTATLINLARGGLVDDAALADALRTQRLFAAGLDVFEGEPVVHPALLALPNVVLTPHIASATDRTRRAMAMLAADNLIAALGHGPQAGRPPNLLNPDVLAQRTGA